MPNTKDLLEPWTSGRQTAEESKLQAVVAELNAETTESLITSIHGLQEQIRLTAVDFQKFAEATVSRVEKSNQKVSKTNQRLALSLNILTFLLVAVGLVQAFGD